MTRLSSPAPRTPRRQSGMAMMLTLFALLGLFMMVSATFVLSYTVSNIASRGSQKMQATALAEAGLNSFYDTIRTTMVNNNGASYPAAPSSPTTLTSTMSGSTVTIGTYTAQYVGTPTSVTSSINNGTQTQTVWTFTIEGIGTSALNGTVSKVQATYTGTIIQNNASSGFTGPIGFGPGALQSNTTIVFDTNGGLRMSDNSNSNSANVIANNGVGWVPYNQSRSNANPNTITVAGNIETMASPSSAYSYTTSPTTGLYKSAGSAIFQSSTNAIVGMTSPDSLPSATQVSAWQANWLTESQSTGNITNGNVNASQVTPNPTNPGQGEHRITAPAYINGNLNVDSGQLYLQPNSNSSEPNVIYVTGNVTNGALLYNRGVDLIVVGQYLETSTSAQYQLQTQNSPYSSLTTLYGVAALVSLKASTTAIDMYTSASSAEGLIYAANGGVTVNGNNEVSGAIIAGGTGSAGGMNINPLNGNSFVVNYVSQSVVGRTDFNTSSSGTGTTAQAFTPSRFTSWVQLQ